MFITYLPCSSKLSNYICSSPLQQDVPEKDPDRLCSSKEVKVLLHRTRALAKLRIISHDSVVEIAAIRLHDINKLLASLDKTEANFELTLEEAQEFCPDGEGESDAFQEEETECSESFNDSVSNIRNLGATLLALKNMQLGMADLMHDIMALEGSVAEEPATDYSSAMVRIQSLFTELRKNWKKLDVAADHSIKLELDAYIPRINSLEANLSTLKGRSAIPPVSSPLSHSFTTRTEKTKSKLPSISLPTFKGGLLEWPTFWREFSLAVDSEEDLPDSTKLAYLRAAVKDPAAKTMMYPSMDGPGTYKRLVDELHQRYQRTKKIHRELVDKLYSLPAAKNTVAELTQLLDSAKNCVECLAATGNFNLEAFITSIIYNKLPNPLKLEWEKDNRKDKKISPYPKLFEYIAEWSYTLGDATTSLPTPTDPPEKRPARRHEKKQGYQAKQKSQVYSVAPPATPTTPSSPSSHPSTYKWECLLCRPEKHPLHTCPKWNNYTVAQRLSHIKDKKLCSNCLAVGHLTANCKSLYRCRDCGQLHHTSIHQSSPASVPVNSTTMQSQQVPDALLMTASVLLKGPGGHEMQARAFIDPGAALSLISSRVTQILNLPLEPNRISFSTVQGTPCKGSKHITSVTIAPLHGKKEIKCRPAVVQTVTEDIPNKTLASVHEFPHLTGLQLADTNFNVPGRVDILLGADLWFQIQGKAPPVSASATEPGAQDTIFGWAISGPVQGTEGSTQGYPAYHIQPDISNTELYNLAYDFWLKEGVEEHTVPVSLVEEQVQEHYDNHHSYSSSLCRYQVALPRKPDCQPLGDSRPQAVQRFFSTEKTSIRKGVHKEVQQQLQGYLDAQHAERVPPEELLMPHFYLPFHCVYKEGSTSTKIRVVFDGSALTSNGTSLNQMLQIGPTLHPTLVDILLKFRVYPIAVTADVKGMYREVELVPKDRDLHRFIWRPTSEEPIQDFRMTRVTFGVSASPYLAVRTLQQTARDHGSDYPVAAGHVKDSFYVDDLLAGAQTEQEAKDLFHDLRAILQRGGFNLCKWRSSSPAVLQSIPKDLQEKMPIKDATTLHITSQPKALGLQWDSRQDCMTPSIHTPSSYRKTKRGIISDVSKTFDVLGWIAPAVLPMKILYQKLWEKGQEWDSAAPPEVIDHHARWREELPCLSTRKLSRCYTVQPTFLRQELHGFADASIKACGAVVYLRTTYSNHPPTVALVTAKTKVAKKDPPTIPKLELCAALLLTKLLNNVSATLNISIDHTTAWTDSSIVLAWLDGRPREFKQFVANRVSFILEHTQPQTWKHVPTKDNPADCASRGMAPAELLHHELWWHGPDWLYQDPVVMPDQPPRRTLPALEIRTVHATLIQAEFALKFESRTNNYYLIVTMVAWWLRLFCRLRDGQPVPDTRSKHLTPQELQAAEHWLLKRSQHRCFPKDIHSLQQQGSTAPSSRLRALTAFIDEEGLIRVGGRLANSSLILSQRHPIIVDSRDSLIIKLFQHKHITLSHCGPSLLLCQTSSKLHVLGARRLSRDICRNCVVCKRVQKHPHPVPQKMGELPAARSQADQPAFTDTGMDFAGPFVIRQGHTRRPVKIEAYICIFICLATKAIHLEVTSAVNTEAFTACLKRFVSRRNCPKTLSCDNGPGFSKARKELELLYDFLSNEHNNNIIQEYLLKHRVQWKQIPAESPHFGGLWESAVRSMKRHLRRVMGTLLLTFEELTTIACQVEACLNSRPLIPITSHSQDGLAPLTASHFLLLNAPGAYPEDPRLPEEPRLLRHWNQCQSVIQHFWSRWSREYLHTLQARTKWQQCKPNLQVDDIVIVRDDRQFVSRWPLARITQVYPGEDGLVRVAMIQPAEGAPRKRPVTKLALLYRDETTQASTSASPGSMSRQSPDSASPD